MLISTAAERCVAQMDLVDYKNSKVFPDYADLAPQVDKNYVQGYFELHLAKLGVIITRDEKEADYTMRVIAGTLATASYNFLLGTPPLPIPITETSLNIVIPELAFFKKYSRQGYGKFSVTVLDSKTHRPLKVIDGVQSHTQVVNWTILFVPFTSSNFYMVPPEMQSEMKFDFFD